MLLAELDANGWAVIIAAIGVVMVQITQMILSHLREQRTSAKLKIIERQTNGDLTKAIAAAAAEVVVRVAEETARNLYHTATAAATAASTAAALSASTAAAAAAATVNKGS